VFLTPWRIRRLSRLMVESMIHDRRTIHQAWAWHSWSPHWLPGRATALVKRLALSRFATPGVCELDTGRKMLVSLNDAVQCTIAHRGEWEGEIHQALRQFVGSGDVVLDVGGHVGYSSLHFADWVGGQGEVFVFEPIPANAARIEANLELNGLRDRVEIIQSAVSDSAGEVEFVESSSLNTGMGAISVGRGTRRVKTIALDNWLEQRNIDRVALLKLDIEGAEILALKGLLRTLASQRIGAVMMELHTQQLPLFGSSSQEVLDRLSAAGYRLSFWDDVGSFIDGPIRADCSYVLAVAGS
jgi:FkbM family methyltransferase